MNARELEKEVLEIKECLNFFLKENKLDANQLEAVLSRVFREGEKVRAINRLRDTIVTGTSIISFLLILILLLLSAI